MADRRGARVYPVTIPDTFTGTALINSPSGVLAPGTHVSVRLSGQWRAAVVRAGHAHGSYVCLDLATPAAGADGPW